MDSIVVTAAPSTDVDPAVAAAAAAEAAKGRPAGLPEKFKTIEELATSYAALEQKLGAGAPDAAAVAAKAAADEAAAAAAIAAKGIDMAALSAEYAKDGKLSATSLLDLAKRGISAEMIDTYIKDQNVKAEANQKDVYDSVGGKEKFDKLLEFAKTSMTAAEVKAYNDAAAAGQYASLKLILAGVQTKFEAAFGKDPKLTPGANGGDGALDMFSNMQDYMTAQRKPEYAKDANYRAKVDAKLERSTFYKQAQ